MTVVGECSQEVCDAAAQSPCAAPAMLQCSGAPEEATKPAQAAGAAAWSGSGGAMCTQREQALDAPVVAKQGIPEESTSRKLSFMLEKYKSENEALHETLQVLLEENQELASENACSRKPTSPGWFNSFRFRGIA